jgi:hypothetical protein
MNDAIVISDVFDWWWDLSLFGGLLTHVSRTLGP